MPVLSNRDLENACKLYFGEYADQMIINEAGSGFCLLVSSGKFPKIELGTASCVKICKFSYARNLKDYSQLPVVVRPFHVLFSIIFDGTKADYEESVVSVDDTNRILRKFFDLTDVASVCKLPIPTVPVVLSQVLDSEICRVATFEMTTRFQTLFRSVITIIRSMPGYNDVSFETKQTTLKRIATKICIQTINEPANWPQSSTVFQHADFWDALDKISTLMEHMQDSNLN